MLTRRPLLARRQLANHLLLNQATFATDVTTGFGAPSNCTVARDASPPAGLTGSALRMTSTSTGFMSLGTSSGAVFAYRVSVVAGNTYTAMMYTRATGGVTQPCRLDITWYDSAGTTLSSTVGGNTTNSTSAWTQYINTAVAPANAAYARPLYRINNTTTVGEIHEVMQGFLGPGMVATWSSP